MTVTKTWTPVVAVTNRVEKPLGNLTLFASLEAKSTNRDFLLQNFYCFEPKHFLLFFNLRYIIFHSWEKCFEKLQINLKTSGMFWRSKIINNAHWVIIGNACEISREERQIKLVMRFDISQSQIYTKYDLHLLYKQKCIYEERVEEEKERKEVE